MVNSVSYLEVIRRNYMTSYEISFVLYSSNLSVLHALIRYVSVKSQFENGVWLVRTTIIKISPGLFRLMIFIGTFVSVTYVTHQLCFFMILNPYISICMKIN